MSTIKTWAERAESLSDDTVVTSLHLAQFKQAEIDELRAENERLKSALLTNDTTIESANNAAGMLEAENARLRCALNNCEDALNNSQVFIRAAGAQGFGKTCIGANDIALEEARAALGES